MLALKYIQFFFITVIAEPIKAWKTKTIISEEKQMELKDLFGTAVLILAITMVLIGLPGQIRKNCQERRCGQPFSLVILALGVYTARMAYAITIHAWYILIPDTAGAVLSGIILRQYYKYP